MDCNLGLRLSFSVVFIASGWSIYPVNAQTACKAGDITCNVEPDDVVSGFGGSPKFGLKQLKDTDKMFGRLPGSLQPVSAPQVTPKSESSLFSAPAVVHRHVGSAQPAKLQKKCSPGFMVGASPFSFTVDGKKSDGSVGSSESDAQTCTDAALEQADVQVRYDGLVNQPRLGVVASPDAVNKGSTVAFSTYSNYALRLKRGEIRIFNKDATPLLAPLAVVPVTNGGASWVPPRSSDDRVIYVLRVYDKEGRFDETKPQTLDLADIKGGKKVSIDPTNLVDRNLRLVSNIPVAGGSIVVTGKNIAPNQTVTVMGLPAVVDSTGKFAYEQILAPGEHDVEVAIADGKGVSTVLSRNAIIPERDLFYVGLADATVGINRSSGSAELLNPNPTTAHEGKHYINGRLAFYLKGRQGETTVTASADTRDQPIGRIFSNFMSKDPRYVLRNLDPTKYYPVYGDDSTLVDDAPTRGKFYVKVEHKDSSVTWGNFKTTITGTEFVRYDRGLYGARAQTKTTEFTKYGERRGSVEVFAAEPGTLGVRDVFIGTGGSLYFLSRQSVSEGSERITIETRDSATGLVLSSKTLAVGQDYDVNYLQGRVSLKSTLSLSGGGDFIVQTFGSSGNQQYLVVNYEYSPLTQPTRDFVVGGRTSYWLNDHVEVGVTGYKQTAAGEQLTIGGADITIRKSPNTYIKIEGARSSGRGAGENLSYDGGFTFTPQIASGRPAFARRIETSSDISEIFPNAKGRLSAYWKKKDAGYSGPGELALNNAAAGEAGILSINKYNDHWSSKVKVSNRNDSYRDYTAGEANVTYAFNNNWAVTTGLRIDDNKVKTITASPDLNQAGRRVDAALRLDYNSQKDWGAYSFIQGTVDRTGERQANNRFGVGGFARLTEKTTASVEGSVGNLGLGAKIGFENKVDDTRTTYANYAVNPDRTDVLERGGLGSLVSGGKQRFNDNVSVFAEERLRHGAGFSGLTHAFGMDFTPDKSWKTGLKAETGKLTDPVSGTISRTAISPSFGYTADGISYSGRVEYRHDNKTSILPSIGNFAQRSKSDTYVAANSLTIKINPNWRFLTKVNGSYSTSTINNFTSGNFFEGVTGFAYRPVENDAFNMLFKYTFFYNVPTSGQVVLANSFNNYSQRSHVLSTDAIYDLNKWVSIGGKYGLRISQVKDNILGGAWYTNDAQLLIARADIHIVKEWDLSFEARDLYSINTKNNQIGALIGLYRQVNTNLKVGGGYNFTKYSDDLTNLKTNNRGFFINAIGMF